MPTGVILSSISISLISAARLIVMFPSSFTVTFKSPATGASLTFTTSKSKAGSEAVLFPSVTEITISVVIFTSSFVGVPLNTPVVALNSAHVGRFTILNVKLSSSTSLNVGIKLYASSSFAVPLGVPEITGASFTAFTINLNDCVALRPSVSVTVTVTLLSPNLS